MVKLTGKQRYRQVNLKALLLIRRAVKDFNAGRCSFIQGPEKSELLALELDRAYEAGLGDGMVGIKAAETALQAHEDMYKRGILFMEPGEIDRVHALRRAALKELAERSS